MTKDEVIAQLIKDKKIVQIGDEYHILEPTKRKSNSVYCKNLPERYKTVTVRQQYNFFIADAEIPFKSSGNLVYLLHTKSKEAEIIFIKEVIENPEIDYNQLIQNIKSYYKEQNAVKYPVSKLFTAGLWRGLYENKVSVKPSNTQMR